MTKPLYRFAAALLLFSGSLAYAAPQKAEPAKRATQQKTKPAAAKAAPKRDTPAKTKAAAAPKRDTAAKNRPAANTAGKRDAAAKTKTPAAAARSSKTPEHTRSTAKTAPRTTANKAQPRPNPAPRQQAARSAAPRRPAPPAVPSDPVHNEIQAAAPRPSAMSRGDADDLISSAMGLLGVAYRFGGTSPTSGFDCSGFMQYIFRKAFSVSLPRTSAAQATVGTPVSRSELQTGDMVFFRTRGSRISHVGLYIGNNRFIHAPRTGKSIEITSLSSGYWSSRYATARRVKPHNAQNFTR